jgi:hypothetical protein
MNKINIIQQWHPRKVKEYPEDDEQIQYETPQGDAKAAVLHRDFTAENDQVKEDEMGRACNTNRGEEECI